MRDWRCVNRHSPGRDWFIACLVETEAGLLLVFGRQRLVYCLSLEDRGGSAVYCMSWTEAAFAKSEPTQGVAF